MLEWYEITTFNCEKFDHQITLAIPMQICANEVSKSGEKVTYDSTQNLCTQKERPAGGDIRANGSGLQGGVFQ
jgi:hypothetical protein